MPKTISLGTVTLTGLRMRRIQFHVAPTGGVGECVVTYELLREDGSVHEIKHQGNYSVPVGVATVVQAWWAQVEGERRTAEGI